MTARHAKVANFCQTAWRMKGGQKVGNFYLNGMESGVLGPVSCLKGLRASAAQKNGQDQQQQTNNEQHDGQPNG